MRHLGIQQRKPNFFSTSRDHLFLIDLNRILQAQLARLNSFHSVNVARDVGDRMVGALAAVYMRSQNSA